MKLFDLLSRQAGRGHIQRLPVHLSRCSGKLYGGRSQPTRHDIGTVRHRRYTSVFRKHFHNHSPHHVSSNMTSEMRFTQRAAPRTRTTRTDFFLCLRRKVAHITDLRCTFLNILVCGVQQADHTIRQIVRCSSRCGFFPAHAGHYFETLVLEALDSKTLAFE